MAELGLRKREGVGWVGARLARTVLEFCVFFMQSQNRESVIMNCCTGIRYHELLYWYQSLHTFHHT